ncbi:MAG: PEP-CTERM sorting domain-containing protein [Candidatus Sulfotelmatobacter sp.]
MSDPVGGNVQKIRRRRSRRHRRNRSIRRWLSLVTLATCVAAASAVALQYLSPSLFRARQSAVPSFEQSELSRSRVVEMNQILSQAQPSADRPVYPYSLVPGGVQDAKELKWVAEHDPVVAAHYAGFDYDHARVVRLTLARTVYLSYRIGNHVYWTRHRVTLHKGEKLITDGRMSARTRCANRVEEMPQQATSRAEPPAEKFDQPIAPTGGTAMQSPPTPFQSALLQQPAAPGLGPVGPLALYDPFVGGNWIPIAPPPLESSLCGPVKKNGSVEAGCCPGEVSIPTKKGGPCGAPGVVPEPETWILFVSGLSAVYWARRKLRA